MLHDTKGMGLRSALDQAWYVTLPVLVFMGWVVMKMLSVYDLLGTADSLTAGVRGTYIGPAFVSGVAGLVVMGIVALLFLVLFSELGETTPSPSAWPPQE